MKLRIALALLVALIAAPAFAQKIYIDYDKNYESGSAKTFAWAKTEETSVESSNPLLHSRIVNAIEHYLSMGGLHETDSDPDLYVTYHGSTEQEMSLNTTHWGYDYPGGWGHYGPYYGGYGGYAGFGSSTTSVSTWEVGTLVVDVWDARTEKLIWRGIADNITVTQNPTKMEKKIDKALKKMIDKWQKIKDKG